MHNAMDKKGLAKLNAYEAVFSQGRIQGFWKGGSYV